MPSCSENANKLFVLTSRQFDIRLLCRWANSFWVINKSNPTNFPDLVVSVCLRRPPALVLKQTEIIDTGEMCV